MHAIFTKFNQSSLCSGDVPLQDCNINPVYIDKSILMKIILLRGGKRGKMSKKLPREIRRVENTKSSIQLFKLDIL